MSLLYSQENISRNELNLLETPAALGRFHQPFGFGEYVDNVYESLDLLGLEVRNEEFEVTHDNNRLFGALEVGLKEGDLITSDEWETPAFEEHCHADAGAVTRSGWRLFNAATEALKPATASSNSDTNALTRRTQVVSGFLNEVVGL